MRPLSAPGAPEQGDGRLRRRPLLLAGALPLASAPAQGQAPGWLRVATAGDEADLRFDYPLTLLERLLRASGLNLRLQGVPVQSQRQTVQWLAENRLDVAILPTVGVAHPELPVLRFPIRRGLLGARLLLARREQAPQLARLSRLQTLQRGYRMGYGADWHDRELLERIGFRLRAFSSYPELFAALADGRVDVLSRGVNEIWSEIDHPTLVPRGLVVVPGVALSYPLDDYFHLAPARRDWLAPLAQGLQRLEQSGEFRQLFLQTYGRALERAAFARRRVFEVIGYGVDAGTPMSLFDAVRLLPTQAAVRLPP